MSVPGDSGLVVRVRDVDLHLWEGLVAPPSSDDQQIYLFKDRRFLSALSVVFDALAPKRMVEIGIYDGGSAIYWEDRYRPERLSLFDIAPEAPYLSRYIGRHNLAGVMRLHLGVSQDDRPALRAAVAEDFAGAQLDLVIDDASHQHAATRSAFETLFPFLRPGGLYVIEDWAWGHARNWPPDLWADRPLMSPLLSEIMLICGANSGVIERLEIDPNFALVWRGPALLPVDESFELSDHYVARGFVGVP